MQFGSKMVKINKKRIDFVCDVEKIRKVLEILCLMRYGVALLPLSNFYHKNLRV